jgi:hypothetical protein
VTNAVSDDKRLGGKTYEHVPQPLTQKSMWDIIIFFIYQVKEKKKKKRKLAFFIDKKN